MSQYKCWDPETGDEEGAVEIASFYPENAARMYAERRYDADDYPERRRVDVRDPEGKVHHFVVRAEPSVDFYATEIQ